MKYFDIVLAKITKYKFSHYKAINDAMRDIALELLWIDEDSAEKSVKILKEQVKKNPRSKDFNILKDGLLWDNVPNMRYDFKCCGITRVDNMTDKAVVEYYRYLIGKVARWMVKNF